MTPSELEEMLQKQTETWSRVRAKQDKLIALVERRHLCEDLQISSYYAGSPTVRQLRSYVWPEWENAIEDTIAYLEGAQ